MFTRRKKYSLKFIYFCVLWMSMLLLENIRDIVAKTRWKSIRIRWEYLGIEWKDSFVSWHDVSFKTKALSTFLLQILTYKQLFEPFRINCLGEWNMLNPRWLMFVLFHTWRSMFSGVDNEVSRNFSSQIFHFIEWKFLWYSCRTASTLVPHARKYHDVVYSKLKFLPFTFIHSIPSASIRVKTNKSSLLVKICYL